MEKDGGKVGFYFIFWVGSLLSAPLTSCLALHFLVLGFFVRVKAGCGLTRFGVQRKKLEVLSPRIASSISLLPTLNGVGR